MAKRYATKPQQRAPGKPKTSTSHGNEMTSEWEVPPNRKPKGKSYPRKMKRGY